jgi:hypothetical protein
VKVGAEDKKKTTIAVVLFAFALLAILYELWPSSNSGPSAPAAKQNTAGKGRTNPIFSRLDPSLRLDLLKGSEDLAYEGSGRDIFHSQAPPPEIPKVDVSPVKEPDTPVAPVAKTNPPIPLKFYGFATASNRKQIFLAQGEDVFVVKEGDIVKNRYKIVRVNNNNVEIQDVLGNYSQNIPLTLPNS